MFQLKKIYNSKIIQRNVLFRMYTTIYQKDCFALFFYFSCPRCHRWGIDPAIKVNRCSLMYLSKCWCFHVSPFTCTCALHKSCIIILCTICKMSTEAYSHPLLWLPGHPTCGTLDTGNTRHFTSGIFYSCIPPCAWDPRQCLAKPLFLSI